MPKTIDPEFTALPYRELGHAALAEAKKLGATYADFRFEKIRTQSVSLKDSHLESLVNNEAIGYAVRVIHNGSWGFASGVLLDPKSAAKVAATAIDVAKTLAVLNSEPVELADEPPHQGIYISDYKINPFSVPEKQKIEFISQINAKVMASKLVDHVDFRLHQVLENKYFASLGGSDLTQQRIRLQGNFEALKVNAQTGAFETMRSLAPPVGQGWEYLEDGYNYTKEAEELPELLAQKIKAPSIKPGRYDLVIDPSNLWLTIHESIGHATELDRVLGYEANYAGTSFATIDKINKLQYGSDIMNVTGDRNAKHGLASIGYDDEGVEASQWDIIKDGVLTGYQLNRQMAKRQGFNRSNGCAYADSPGHVPLQRMPNVTLQPSPKPTTTNDLIAQVKDGIYIVGDKSWSIDMQRYNFQFTGQRFFRIQNGKLAGQVKDVAYQSNTVDFWNSLSDLGGPDTFVLGGAMNCGKGQPGQVASVSHGCPSALYRHINILNTVEEGAK
jgi:TldD protein